MIYTEKVIPRIGDYAFDEKLSYESIIFILENMGSRHTAYLNGGKYEWGVGNAVWVLADWRMEIERRPEKGEELCVSTWVRKGGAGVSLRNILIADESGSELVRAEGRYALFDIESGRPVRVTAEIQDYYQPEDRMATVKSAVRQLPPEGFGEQMPFALRRTDIDFNGHVHNTRYIEIALEALPKEVYENCDFKDIFIRYMRPLMSDANVTVGYKQEDGEHVVGIFADGALASYVKLK